MRAASNTAQGTSPSKADASGQKMMTNKTIQNYLKVLSLNASYSVNLTRKILEFNSLKLVETFLPSVEDQKKLNFSADHYPFIMEVISLIDALLPSREESSI